ncbi:terminase small subunit [Escherichia coli]|nr:terminase small subunit [Escherichia coli]NWP89317.1 terminase small subunit [Escherichia coli]
MKVNKKRLAEIFNVDPRTIERWQSQGLPCASKGSIDMPAGHGHMTLEFSVSAWLVNNWYPTASISDLLVVVMKKATAGITIS